MPVKVNLRHLEEKNLFFEGEISPEELEMVSVDELIEVTKPLHYNLEVERQNETLLVHGSIRQVLDCQCARCLKPFLYEINLDPWDAIVPLLGEEAVKVDNDCVDLTPFIREDTLLAFPPHPVCRSDCSGLKKPAGMGEQSAGPGETDENSSAWAALNKLKF